MNNIEEYRRYIRKCEMLGIKDFEFMEYPSSKVVELIRYIPNKEEHRRLVIPDFVNKISEFAFSGVEQSLSIEYKGNTGIDMYSSFWAYKGEEIRLKIKNINNVERMFADCTNLTQVDIKGLDLSSISRIDKMFEGCVRLKEISMCGVDTKELLSMCNTFTGCSSIEKIDMSTWDMREMFVIISAFKGCSELREIRLGKNIDMNKLVGLMGAFDECDKLERLYIYKNYCITAHKLQKKLKQEKGIDIQVIEV